MKPVFPFIVLAALVAGCGSVTKSTEYTSAAARSPQAALEVPPELTNPTIDDRFAIPDPKTQTTFSTYSRDRGTAPATAALGVLPAPTNARMERAGAQRWIVVKATPDQLWPILRTFWIETGFVMRRESPELGIMDTDWAENRNKIPEDIIRRTIGRAIDGLYSTHQRDRFRTRLERGAEAGTTEIYIAHYGADEVWTSTSQEKTAWQPRPSDPELEAEMLGRILVKLGYDDKTVLAMAPKAADGKPGAPATPAAPVGNAVLQNNGAGPLVMNDSFDRAWRRVGLALDRVGFTVEDRDRTKGVFFVRYVDPEVDLKDTSKLTWAERLAFWKPTPKAAQPQYRIFVADAGTSGSKVEVQNMQGAVEATSTGKKILGLLYDQLK
ncbi:outer membrane protein assembly factor BamC [Usitatibacter palustris]|uniref:Beta-barrel assembly machine subunit BamC n=1 Tax=Usitatibacter palustris TaxID=2732487 RepID=A0A6M4H7N3_9PROT|nr:outer membrane protein assembly factor BamC [Usitatibacter palustris]QJR14384.1 hypothetical protein DSM104440_01180 [Usitatibacter palustris]